jgi:hypothetical protein
MDFPVYSYSNSRMQANTPKTRFPDTALNLGKVISLFRSAGCTNLHVKELAWNHDSKRQIYLSTDLSAFHLFPNKMDTSPSMPRGLAPTRRKKSQSSNRIYGHLDFHWLTVTGDEQVASKAKLIYYPQYPEVRLSGFLFGVSAVPSEYLREKSGEIYPNRLLFLGTKPTGQTVGFLAVEHLSLKDELRDHPNYDVTRGLNRIPLERRKSSAREEMLRELAAIHQKKWITGRRLSGSVVRPCNHQNAVGYTLEALLGISANGSNKPDFLGYELKAMTLPDFESRLNKSITVMTIEPDLGIYHEKGVVEFLKQWGYPDKRGKPNRRNFGGIHKCDNPADATGLEMRIFGWKQDAPDRFDSTGYLALVSDDGILAAGWSFNKLIDSWKRKHTAAVYVPAIKDKPTGRFWYGAHVILCHDIDFGQVLLAIKNGKLFLDPAVKADKWNSAKPLIKKRMQMRIKRFDVPCLYRQSETVDLKRW